MMTMLSKRALTIIALVLVAATAATAATAFAGEKKRRNVELHEQVVPPLQASSQAMLRLKLRRLNAEHNTPVVLLRSNRTNMN